MYGSESDSKLKLHNGDISTSVGAPSEHCKISIRQIIIEFIDKIDYTFTSYPEFEHLELAVRNEILSFGIDLQPGWETILRTSCAITGMSYSKHPFEIQFSIAVCGVLCFFCVMLL